MISKDFKNMSWPPPAVFWVAHLGFWCLPERSKRNHGRRRTFQMAWPVGVWMWPSWYPPKKQKNNETCQGGMVTFNCPAGTLRTSWGSWKTSKDGFRHAEELIPLRDVPKWLNIEDLQQKSKKAGGFKAGGFDPVRFRLCLTTSEVHPKVPWGLRRSLERLAACL